MSAEVITLLGLGVYTAIGVVVFGISAAVADDWDGNVHDNAAIVIFAAVFWPIAALVCVGYFMDPEGECGEPVGDETLDRRQQLTSGDGEGKADAWRMTLPEG